MKTLTKLAQTFIESNLMHEIYQVPNGPAVVGAWGLDVGTKELKLKLALVYPDGEISPIQVYSKQKLNNGPKALDGLADLFGITTKAVNDIFCAVMKKQRQLAVQEDGSGKCSIVRAYRELCEYVTAYTEPGRVFSQDGYGNILAAYLDTVLDKLELGYSRLEIERNFKAWGLLRVNNGTGHPYTFRIKINGKGDWFLSFKLPTDEEGSEAAA